MGVQGGGMGSRDVALGAWGFRIWCSALGFSLRDVPGFRFRGLDFVCFRCKSGRFAQPTCSRLFGPV